MIHSFFRSIGFREVKKNQELYAILEDVVNNPDEEQVVDDIDGNEFVCFSKNLGNEYGISVCGNFFNNSEFRMEYYYPYFHGSYITTYEPIEIEQHSSRQSFAGICDELKLGVTLIFYIENVIDVIREKKFFKKHPLVENAVLSGLAASGKILFPVMKTNRLIAQKEKHSEQRMNLMQKAREGNKVAIDNLTLNDMDTYSKLSRRISNEDILSIVESSFIPYGIESDQYVVIGEILNCYKTQNPVTEESLWIIALLCNDLKFDICINEKDLLGEPEIGRRFKGRIWLQGHLNFGY